MSQLYTLERSCLLRNLQLREELQLLREQEGKSEAGRFSETCFAVALPVRAKSCRAAGDSAEDKASRGCCRQHDGVSANSALQSRAFFGEPPWQEHTHSMLKVAIGAGWQDTIAQEATDR